MEDSEVIKLNPLDWVKRILQLTSVALRMSPAACPERGFKAHGKGTGELPRIEIHD